MKLLCLGFTAIMLATTSAQACEFGKRCAVVSGEPNPPLAEQTKGKGDRLASVYGTPIRNGVLLNNDLGPPTAKFQQWPLTWPMRLPRVIAEDEHR